MEPDPAPATGRGLTVAFACLGWPPENFANGVVTSIGALIGGWEARGHRAVIMVKKGPAGDDRRVLVLGQRASRTPWGRLRDGLEYRLAPDRSRRRRICGALIEATRRAVAEYGLDLLEVEEAFGWARWVAPEVPVPVVVRLHGPWFLNGPALGVPQDRAFTHRVRDEGAAIAAAAGITAPSLDVLERTRAFYGLPLERAAVIPNPVPPVAPERGWRREACDPDLILFIGRFDRHKGGDLIIDAFARLARAFPRARLRFIGPDPGLIDEAGKHWTLEAYLRARVPDPATRARVQWLGRRPNSELDSHRAQAAVTVIGSRYETFGLTLTEAMAMGCPIVAARAGALGEILRDGQTGLLCRPDDPEDLAAKLAILLGDADLAAEMGRQAGLDCAARFYPEAVAARTETYYRELLSR